MFGHFRTAKIHAKLSAWQHGAERLDTVNSSLLIRADHDHSRLAETLQRPPKTQIFGHAGNPEGTRRGTGPDHGLELFADSDGHLTMNDYNGIILQVRCDLLGSCSNPGQVHLIPVVHVCIVGEAHIWRPSQPISVVRREPQPAARQTLLQQSIQARFKEWGSSDVQFGYPRRILVDPDDGVTHLCQASSGYTAEMP